MFVLLCSFTKKKTGSVFPIFFPPFCHATFHHALITCCNVARAGYIAKSRPRDQEWTDGSPCLVEWKSRNITRGFILYCRDSPRVFNFHFPFGTSPSRSGETYFLVSTLILPFTFPSLRFEYSELGATTYRLAVKGNSYICKLQGTTTICNEQSTNWMVSFF